MLYFLLTGQAPFGGKTRSEQWRRASQCDFDRAALRAKGIPRRLERIVLKAMAAEPEGRYASADDMAVALDAFLRRPRRLALQAAVLLLAALAAAGWSLWPRPARVSNPTGRIDSAPAAIPRAGPRQLAGPAALSPCVSSRSRSHCIRGRRAIPRDRSESTSSRAGWTQDARVQARLNMPAYCYLIALIPTARLSSVIPKSRRSRRPRRPRSTTRPTRPWASA